MKNLLLFFVLFIANNNTDNVTINEVRILFQKSANEQASCKKMIDILKPYTEKNNTAFAGYKASARMMMAKYAINPIIKLTNFSQGKKLLEKCIAIDKENIELRFLRFTIQCNAPSFLGYNNCLKEDKLFLISNVATVKDDQLKQMISHFLTTSGCVTKSEKG
jgi:hypothetical protein